METNEILIEKSLLSILIQTSNKELVQQAINRLNKDYFSTDIHQWTFNVISDYFINFAEIPTKLIFKTKLELLEEPKKSETRIILKTLYSLPLNESTYEYLSQKVINQKKYSEYLKLTNTSLNTITVDNVNTELDSLFIKLSNISSESSKDQCSIRRFDLSENILDQITRIEEINNTDRGIPTPLTDLNESIGGMKKQQLMVISAPVGSGKSILLLNFAEFAYAKGYNVLFFTIEMSYEDVESRHLSYITKVDASKIMKQIMDGKDKKQFYKELFLHYIIPEQHNEFLQYYKTVDFADFSYKEFYKNISEKFQTRKNHMYIRDIPSNCTVERMKAEFKYIQKTTNIDLIVIDYLNIIEPSYRTRVEWQDANHIARNLKELARELDVHVLTAAQLKTAEDEDTPNLDDLRFAKAIADHADWMIGFSRSDQDRLCGRIRLQLMKARHSTSKTIAVRESFSRMGISNFIELDPPTKI